jgi:hypothetical protein
MADKTAGRQEAGEEMTIFDLGWRPRASGILAQGNALGEGRWRNDGRLKACFMTGEASVGGMMGQAFSLRVPLGPQPRAAAAMAALPWARMDEAVGLGGKAIGLVFRLWPFTVPDLSRPGDHEAGELFRVER